MGNVIAATDLPQQGVEGRMDWMLASP